MNSKIFHRRLQLEINFGTLLNYVVRQDIYYNEDSKLQKLINFSFLIQFINILQVRSLISDESSFSRYSAPTAQSSAVPEDIIGSQVLDYMSQVGRLRKTGLGMVEKKGFLDFYKKRASGYAKKNRQFCEFF